jgi:poly-gamma-glutamate capsule biosynthesis protein CapA/YwtB (metallophosphatase superfamily)
MILSHKFYVRLIFLLFIFLPYSRLSASNPLDSISQLRPDSLSIVFAGDIMGHGPQVEAAYDSIHKVYDYSPVFKYIRPYVEKAGIAIANLEVTLAGRPYKGYPQFSSPDAIAVAAKEAGFDLLINANNHCLDRGRHGLERTIKVLDSLGISHTGTFRNRAERDSLYPFIVVKNNIKLAILNYTYGTNGLTVESPNVVNYIDTAQIKKDIAKSKKMSADFIMVTIHWGIEYERVANRDQKNLAHWLLKNGVNAIIGMHPHVIQPVEVIYPNPADSSFKNIVVYSLGNFVSNQPERFKNGGILFELDLVKTDITRISGYNFTPAWVYRKNKYSIVPAKSFLQNKLNLKMDDSDRDKINQFYDDTKLHLQGIPENQYDFSL